MASLLVPIEARGKHFNKRFTKRGYGRIFVNKLEDIQEVIDSVAAVDEFEAEYMPGNFVAVWKGSLADLVPNGKFELDYEDLTRFCWDKGIYIFCVDREPIERP